MPTLEELCKNYGVNTDEQEKVASVPGDSEVEQLTEEVTNTQVEGETTATENGGEDMGLHEMYEEVFANEEQEQVEKTASADEMEKVAADYVAAGRFMARGFADEMEKIASERATEQMSDTEKIPTQLHAEGAMGAQINDDAPIPTNTEEARNANSDALREKYVWKMLGKKKGLNPSGQTGEDHKVARDAARK